MAARRPVVGISADVIDHNGLARAAVPTTYIRAVTRAGGVPVALAPVPTLAVEMLGLCDAVVLTGGDDPIMETFGVPTDPRVTRVRPERQEAEIAMLAHLSDERPDVPVLGVCLGMQYMALHAGGTLDQHMPETTPTHADHWERSHDVHPESGGWLADGTIASKHRQAISAPGTLRVISRAHDGVVEAIDDPGRRFYVGVQWHPERTAQEELGERLFRLLVRSAS